MTSSLMVTGSYLGLLPVFQSGEGEQRKSVYTEIVLLITQTLTFLKFPEISSVSSLCEGDTGSPLAARESKAAFHRVHCHPAQIMTLAGRKKMRKVIELGGKLIYYLRAS